MKVAKPLGSNTEYCQNISPSLEVACGEEFFVETELCSGPWLEDENTIWTLEKELPGNILTCIRVTDAGYGDMLKVNILSIIPKSPAYGGLEGPDTFPYPALFLGNKYKDPDVRIIPIDSDRVIWGGVNLKAAPMIGCIGTARPAGRRSSDFPDPCGGNLDVSEITAGASVYLPVCTPEALLFIGDMHAIQGDGEITGWGAECRGGVQLKVEKVPTFPFRTHDSVLIENDKYWMAAGFGEGFEKAYNASVLSLLEFVSFASKRDKRDVYMQMGLTMKCHIAQSCFPEWPVFLAKLSKKHLPTTNCCDNQQG